MNDSQTTSSPTKSGYSWRFFRAGGVDQVLIRNGADIANLESLDLKLWFALSMPTVGIEFDAATLAFIDTDKDKRIRPPEILAAVRWARDAFVNLDDLAKGGDRVQLPAIKDENIRKSATHILAMLGKGTSDTIALDDVLQIESSFAMTKFNGDGVIPPESADDEDARKALADIIATIGGVADRSGILGVDTATLDTFFAEAAQYAAWNSKSATNPAILPLGEATAAAVAAVNAVRVKIDDYFARVHLATFDPRALTSLNRQESEYLGIASKDITINAQEVAGFPIALIGAGEELPLSSGINPAWEAAVSEFRQKAVVPIIGGKAETLAEAEWNRIKETLAPYKAWQAEKPVTGSEKLGAARMSELFATGAKEKIAALIAQDLAMKPEYEQIGAVEKLVRFQRDFLRLLNNYVNFADFYQRRGAIFQAGDLYLDARACHLCIEVTDAASHASLAGLAGMYLAYCDLTRPSGEKKTIAAAFTNGDGDNLMVGRNGVFYDRKGRDWDARITKVITNPISLKEAFWSPYKKLQRFIEEMIAKRASAADTSANTKLSSTAETVATADKSKAEAAAPKKLDMGTFAVLAVAFSAIGATLSALATGLMSLSWWQIPLVMAGLILLISTPSMVMAWLKLKRRNIAPILDANGWAINTRAKINTPFGAAMTDSAKIPAQIAGRLIDPFAEKKSHWQVYAIIAVIVIGTLWTLNQFGLINRWTDGIIGKPLHQAVTESSSIAPSAEMPKGAEPSAAPAQ